jgi:ribosomal protein L11 methyltransferase
MIELFPEGFEESDRGVDVQLAAYTGGDGEQRLREAFADVSSEPVADDWQDRWRSFHRPTRVGPLWVGPSWEPAPDDALAVVIDPGRAFGTGSHPTTRLSLELLLELEPGSLLDLGCGSGVLAIAGAKLGFAPVYAFDADEAAVEVAQANAERNVVAVQARLADALTALLPTADVAVANIALDVVEAVVPRVDAGVVVTSGYLDSQRPALAAFEHAEHRTQDGWAADLFRAK